MRFVNQQDDCIGCLKGSTSATLTDITTLKLGGKITTTNTNYGNTLKDVIYGYNYINNYPFRQRESYKNLFIDKNNSVTTTTTIINNLSANERIIRNWQQENRQLFQSKLDKQFFNIRQRKTNWDFRNSPKPNSQSVSNAENTLRDILLAVIDSGRVWYTPFLTSDEDGFVNIEWHKGHHELHLVVEEQEVEYIKVWGVNIKNEMTLDILDKANFINLWDWLLNG